MYIRTLRGDVLNSLDEDGRVGRKMKTKLFLYSYFYVFVPSRPLPVPLALSPAASSLCYGPLGAKTWERDFELEQESRRKNSEKKQDQSLEQ